MNEDGWFGEEVAATYDDDTASMTGGAAFEAELDLLAALAGEGPALEFAVGTGRVALPLAARGVPVRGIELSRAMIRRLREKPRGDEGSLPVVVGDMTSAVAPGAGSFRLVYLVFNTLMNVTTQEGQVEVFRNAARHLAAGGAFVVEIGVPDLRRLPPGERYVTFDRSDTHVGIDEYEVSSQLSWSHHVNFDPDGRATRVSIPFRYAWPAELDLMARIAGLTLQSRWEDWTGKMFGSESRSHVSVWVKAAGD